jgi:hypothetical protein
MRPVTRTIALFLLLIGVGTGQVAAQANPPPGQSGQCRPNLLRRAILPRYPPPQEILRRRTTPEPACSSNEVLDAKFTGPWQRLARLGATVEKAGGQ